MKLPLKMPRHWHETELGKKIFSSNSPPSQKWYLQRFFEKTQKFFKKFRNMIIHDCLNIFIKNLTVILISSLFLTKFIISTFAKTCVIKYFDSKNALSYNVIKYLHLCQCFCTQILNSYPCYHTLWNKMFLFCFPFYLIKYHQCLSKAL